MNILITGAFGFVGTNLSHSLAAAGKHRLIALDLFQLVAQSPPVYPNGAELMPSSTSPAIPIILRTG